MPGEPDPLYVRAREVLLDALEALGPHRGSIILVGAQAIYLHTGEAASGLSPSILGLWGSVTAWTR